MVLDDALDQVEREGSITWFVNEFGLRMAAGCAELIAEIGGLRKPYIFERKDSRSQRAVSLVQLFDLWPFVIGTALAQLIQIMLHQQQQQPIHPTP